MEVGEVQPRMVIPSERDEEVLEEVRKAHAVLEVHGVCEGHQEGDVRKVEGHREGEVRRLPS